MTTPKDGGVNGIVFRHRRSRHVVDLSRRREFLLLIGYHVTDRRHHFILDWNLPGFAGRTLMIMYWYDSHVFHVSNFRGGGDDVSISSLLS